MTWQEDERDFLEASLRDMKAKVVVATGELICGLRDWSLFGTLTIDPRRLMDDKVECREAASVEWRGDLGKGFVPYLKGGERVVRRYPRVYPRGVPRDMAVWMVQDAMRAAGRVLGCRIDYVAALEPHRKGDLHAHVLAYTGQTGDVRSDIYALWKGWYSKWGFCKFEPPRDNVAVSDYASKYLSKPGGELIFSSKLHLARDS